MITLNGWPKPKMITFDDMEEREPFVKSKKTNWSYFIIPGTILKVIITDNIIYRNVHLLKKKTLIKPSHHTNFERCSIKKPVNVLFSLRFGSRNKMKPGQRRKNVIAFEKRWRTKKSKVFFFCRTSGKQGPETSFM